MWKWCQNFLSMRAEVETIAECRTTEAVFGELLSYSIHTDINNPFSVFDDQNGSDWWGYAHFLLIQAPGVLQDEEFTYTQLDVYNPQQTEHQVNKNEKQEISTHVVHPIIPGSDNHFEMEYLLLILSVDLFFFFVTQVHLVHSTPISAFAASPQQCSLAPVLLRHTQLSSQHWWNGTQCACSNVV